MELGAWSLELGAVGSRGRLPSSATVAHLRESAFFFQALTTIVNPTIVNPMKRGPEGQTRERVYKFVVKRLEEGEPPTVREVQEAFGFRAVQTARQHLEKLVAEKRLINTGGKARGYRLTRGRSQKSGARRKNKKLLEKQEKRFVAVPILGRVAAGALSMAVEDLEGYVEMMVQEGEEDLFALRVQGKSMTGAGILPGDIVVVRRQASAESGDIVVALVDDEATVKRLQLREGRLELHPENAVFEVIVPEAGECRILGKVVEVRRKF